MTLLKIVGHEQLRKDTHSGAVLNTDVNAYKNTLNAKADRQRLVNLENEVTSLGSKLDNLETLLLKLLHEEK